MNLRTSVGRGSSRAVVLPTLTRLAGRLALPGSWTLWLCLCCCFVSLPAQSLDWHRAGAAGGDANAGGFRLRGAAGQAEAGVAEGGGYRFTGGFWHPAVLGLTGARPPQIASFSLVPASGPPGSRRQARGSVTPAGVTALAMYWGQGDRLRLVAHGQSEASGAFDLPFTVPTDATTGAARVAVVSAPASPENLAYAAFEVVAPAPSRIAGVVRNAAGQGVGAGVVVRLAGPDGLAVAETVTAASGGFGFAAAPLGPHQVQVMTGGYPPEAVYLAPGENVNVQIDPADVSLDPLPAVMMRSAGAVALPGGSYSGKAPVKVGDWSDVPMTRLVSFPGKALPPLQVRFWAELQRITLPGHLPLAVGFQLRKGGQPVTTTMLAGLPQTVYPEGILDTPAFTADFNSLELPPGKLTLNVVAFTAFVIPIPVGQWEFPIEVVDLGPRWYAGHVKNPKLTVTKKDFFTLRYGFSGTLPKLPGLGTPLFDEPLDLEFMTVNNTFNLGVELNEWVETHGFWDGSAKAEADLTLFSVPLINQSRKFLRQGASLANCTYDLEPLTLPLFGDICTTIFGAALPTKVKLCGDLGFSGYIGVKACFDGQVSLTSQILKDLHLEATVAPGFGLALPIGASLELLVCEATAQVVPKVTVSLPIKLDPSHTPPVFWDGLCVDITAKATTTLGCCDDALSIPGLDFELFEPIHLGNCPKHSGTRALMDEEEETRSAPPRHASIAYSPDGFAAAVWENHERTVTGRVRTAPVYSVFNGTAWSTPQPVAGPEFAGWEPHIGFLGPHRAVISWVVPDTGDGQQGVGLTGPQPHGLCDLADDVLDLGCTILGTLAKGVKVVVGFIEDINPFSLAATANASRPGLMEQPASPVVVADGPGWNVRPVLATNPATGDAVVLWLREQEPIPGQQRLLALYYSRLGPDGWSAPQRVDPASDYLDLQPSLRFDRQGRPAAVWVRDLDGDLDTPTDRLLVFSRLGTAWSAPATLESLPPAPWTPSLDFDRNNQAVVAFVVPAADPRTGEPLGGDGTASTLQVARQFGLKWLPQAIGNGLRAERPVVRVSADNHALVFFRGFDLPGAGNPAGEIASAVASLDPSEPRWSTGPLTTDRLLNWQVAAELNPVNGEPLVVWETRDPTDAVAEPDLRGGPQSWAVDLAFAGQGLGFSQTHPTPGTAVEVTARVVNRGLKPLASASFRVSFFDQDPGRGATPFATRTIQGSLGFGQELPVTVSYTPADRAWRTIHVVVDADDAVLESDEANNHAALAWGGLGGPEDFNAAPVEGSGAVRLSWTSPAAEGSVRHWLWRTQVRTGERELLGATEGEEFTDDTVVAGEEYSYQLVAVDSSNVRSATGTTAAVTALEVPPPDPELLHLNYVAYGDAFTLTWNVLPAVQLEAAEALADNGTRWAPVTEGVEQFGGVAQITLPTLRGQRYFRLVLP